MYHRQVTPHDFPQLETVVKKVIKEKQPFERLEVKKEDLLKMFEVGEGSLLFPNLWQTLSLDSVFSGHDKADSSISCGATVVVR